MSLPYFPMYPTDFEADTSHLTLEEDGAYNRLLRLMWMTPTCTFPDDNKWIMRRMRVDQDTFERVVLVVIDEFFIRSKNRVSNARLCYEFTKTNEAHKKRVLAGSLGGKAKSLKTNKIGSRNAVAKPKQPEPEPEPYNKTPANAGIKKTVNNDFDVFWKAYPHKVGKGEARKKFEIIQKTNKANLQKLLDGLSAYIRTKPADRSWCNPATWLHQERWLDQPAEVLNGHAPRKTLAERNRESFERQRAEIMRQNPQVPDPERLDERRPEAIKIIEGKVN